MYSYMFNGVLVSSSSKLTTPHEAHTVLSSSTYWEKVSPADYQPVDGGRTIS